MAQAQYCIEFRFGFGADDSFQFSVQAPNWFTGSVYSALAQRSVSGWQLNLRAYDVIEQFDIELINCIGRDDAASVEKDLDENRISPFVHNRHERSLLQVELASSIDEKKRAING
ncbi:hypothetical protein CCHL11_07882 [Colletotrichum chlorophyti]|uniref:Uncharacterized protein n=1 Tax=Colletotrichum chlorophyti TaxID=708187 RepID=A0A1Q8RR95_9PEZI|nr:hypothetical protein CCHL11_07882 [Colletotrichum chlorophyti]